MSADEKADDAGVVDDEPDWEEACRREEAIRDLLRRHPQRLTYAAVDDVAGQLGLSRAGQSRLSHVGELSGLPS